MRLVPTTLAALTLAWAGAACSSPNPPFSADTAPPETGAPAGDTAAAEGPWRSALYPDDGSPGWSVEVGDGGPPAALPDFSYAGYRAGEAPLPEVDLAGAWSAVELGADPTGATDSTAALQAALDQAAAAGGGVVALSAGTYRVDGLLRVTGSGVVLAGAGPDATFLDLRRAEGMSDQAHLTFAGALEAGEPVALAQDAAQGAFSVTLSEPAALSPGDPVGLGMVISDAFVTEHGMDGFWGFAAGDRRTLFQRTVVDTGDLTQTSDGSAGSCAQCDTSADCGTGLSCNTAGLCE